MDKFIKNKSAFTMIILDIDHFKLINDSYGHVVGDFIIEHISKVLKTCCPSDSVLCRLGGDEFVVCVNYSTEIQVVELLEDITEKLLHYQTPKGQKLIVTASIGAVISLDENCDLDGLYSYADRALYMSKEKGRNQFTFYVED
ncbi:MAG: GGDEF domain-containing protein [Turicibacter sp.]